MVAWLAATQWATITLGLHMLVLAQKYANDAKTAATTIYFNAAFTLFQ